MSRSGSLIGELRQPRVILVLIFCIAVWLKLGMIVIKRIPNAHYPNSHQNAAVYFLRTVIERTPPLLEAAIPRSAVPDLFPVLSPKLTIQATG